MVLNEKETESFIKVCPQKGNSENNLSNSENNLSNSENNSPKEKESKVKESKDNIGATAQPPPSPTKHKRGEFGHVLLTDEEYSRLISDYGDKITAEYIKRLDEYLENRKDKHYANHNLTIRNWINKAGIKKAADVAEPYEFKGW